MAQTIKLKRSSVSGNIPLTTQLDLGEVAINTFDGKMYIKKDDGTEHIVEVGYNLGVVQEYIFTATASQTVFTGLDDNSIGFVYNPGNIQVFLNGVLLEKTVDFTETSSTTLTLSEPVDAADMLQVFSFNKKIGDGRIAVNTFTGDGSTTSFTLSVAPEDVNNLSVYIDGIYQSKSNYTVTGTTLDFGATPPPLDTDIEVEIATREVSIDTTTGLSFADNVKAKFGNDDDLEIFHDGSNSIINDTGTGNVKFQVGGTDVAEVTVDGITVTGDVEADEFIGDLRGAVEFHAQAGEVLAKGDVVYISGISGNTTVVSKADADDPSKMPAFGIISIGGNQNANVEVVTFGTLSGVNTSTFTEGDEIFVSNTAGAYTNTAPTGETSALQKIGKITRADSNGSIKVIGAGRSNATPNLNDGNIFIGNASNQATTASLNTKIEDYLDAGSSTPNFTTANITTGTIGTLTVSTEATIPYDNSISGLTATNVQSAISELNNLLGGGNVGSQASFDSYEFTATTNQTTFDLANLGLSPTPSYIAGYIQVFLNGVLLAEADYTATDGQTIVLGAAADLNDIITVTILDSFDIANLLRVTSFDASAPQDNLVIDANGNVGIGTSPSTQLHVYKATGEITARLETGDSSVAGLRLVNDSAHWRAGIQQTSDYIIRDVTNTRNALTITSSEGNVGIATVSPRQKLEINGGMYTTGSLASPGSPPYASREGAAFDYFSGGARLWSWGDTSSPNERGTFSFIQLENDGENQQTALTITSTGNVGIGTTNISSKLYVEGDQYVVTNSGVAASGIHIGTATPAAQGTYGGAISFDAGGLGASAIAVVNDSPSDVDSNGLAFFTHASGTGSADASERMRISATGNVGIGTTGPQQRLSIVETANYSVPGLGNSGGHFGIFKEDTNSSGDYGIMWGVQADGDVWQQVQRRDGTPTAYDLLLQPSGGKVGIGTTGPSNTLEVASVTDNSGITIYNNFTSGGRNARIGFKSLNGYDASSVLAAITATPTSSANTSTSLVFQTSGDNSLASAGLTERMRIDSNGNVGIGTLNPDAPLDVHVIENTYTNYRTQLRLGHTKTDGTDEGSSLTFTAAGDALGAVIYSNGRYDNDVLVQEDSIRPSGFIAFGNGLPNTGTGIIELGGLVAGTTTPVVNMRMESDGALNLLGAGLEVDGQTLIDTNGSIKSVGSETQLAKTYRIPNTGGTSGWVKFGTFTTAQSGRSIHFKFVSRSGYNANNAQTQMCELKFGTSNNSSAGTALDSSQVQQTSVFFGDAQYYKYEDGNAGNAPNDILILQKSNSSYEFWGDFGSFTGEGSFFVVSHNTLDAFTYSGTTQTAFPTIGASEYYVQKSVIGIQDNIILANYGTGTYTATFGGLANMTGTAVLNEARYTRIGRNLTIEGRITGLSVTTGGTEAVVVMTLPTGGFYMDSNDSRATGSAWDSDRRTIGIVTNNSGGDNTDLAIVFPSYATSSGTTNISFSITYFS